MVAGVIIAIALIWICLRMQSGSPNVPAETTFTCQCCMNERAISKRSRAKSDWCKYCFLNMTNN